MAKQTLNPKDNFYLTGNLGGDPQPHTLPAKTGTYKYYDPMIDEVLDKEYDYPERNFLTFSICTGGFDDIPVRWHYCVDWEGTAFRARKGDLVTLLGQFQDRTYTDKEGNPKTIRQFVVANCEIKKIRVRAEAS